MAEKDMLVSIVIPVYNVRPYLTQALDSVLHQSYKSLEIIIIDDGSTDGSSEICDAYAAKDARVLVVHQTNKGLSAARNAGLDLITADVVAFLDPDDALHESFVEELLSAMIREKADLAICRYTSHRTDGLLNAEGNRKTMPSIASGTYDRIETLRALADNRINVHVWNKLYRGELWKEIRFPYSKRKRFPVLKKKA